jgi:hypothetical protein
MEEEKSKEELFYFFGIGNQTKKKVDLSSILIN